MSVGLYTNGYNFYLQGLGFVSTNEGWIGGASGLPSYTNSFLHTIDGGALLTSNDVATFDVLASTNLASWVVLTNALSLTNGSILFEDSTTNYPARFYRVREH